MNSNPLNFQIITTQNLDIAYDTTYNGGVRRCIMSQFDKATITIPQHNPIKRAYVEEVKAIVESEENDDENA